MPTVRTESGQPPDTALIMDIIFPEPTGREDNSYFERFLYSKGLICVAGCDEAGRGPLAGPVVAACPPNTNTVFPQTMLVDYVRVYKGEI